MFVQIIEGRTSDPEGLLRQARVWDADLRPGATGFLGSTLGFTDDGRAVLLARFASAEDARRNSERPEQGTWWADTEKYFDLEAPSFTDSTDVTLLRGGGSNDAGFVQVMKSSGVDRGAVERLDEDLEARDGIRPDILGLLRAWTGPDRHVEFAYFTSEAEARAAEETMPQQLGEELMAELQSQLANTEFIDLRRLQLS